VKETVYMKKEEAIMNPSLTDYRKLSQIKGLLNLLEREVVGT
jgi:hypothetical protein